MWNKNERDGKIDQAKGKVRQAVATLKKDDDLKAEGRADEARGRASSGNTLLARQGARGRGPRLTGCEGGRCV